MVREGRVVNGAIILDDGSRLPEGVRVRLEVVAEFPDDHPLAPYDREKERAAVRESIEAMKAGEPGIPFRQAMEELSRRHDLPPLPPE